jgi:hypothetical protein
MPLTRRDVAVVERFEAGQDFQQRGFAGAVGAHQADALVGVMSQFRSSKRSLGPKRLPAEESWII